MTTTTTTTNTNITHKPQRVLVDVSGSIVTKQGDFEGATEDEFEDYDEQVCLHKDDFDKKDWNKIISQSKLFNSGDEMIKVGVEHFFNNLLESLDCPSIFNAKEMSYGGYVHNFQLDNVVVA